MIYTLELSTERLRGLLADAGVRLDEEATLRIEASPDERWIACAKVDGTRPHHPRPQRMRRQQLVKPREGYL